MLVRLGQFYAFMLLLICLGTNIVLFDTVREHFLGDGDPVPSAKIAFSELDLQAKIAEFYPKMQPHMDDVENTTHPPLETEKSAPKEQRQQISTSLAKSVETSPVVDPVPVPDPSPEVKPMKEEVPKNETSKSSAPVATSVETLQTAATIPTPKQAVAQSIIADQFRPIVSQQKPVVSIKSIKPSSTPIWETIDTVLEQPIRYD